MYFEHPEYKEKRHRERSRGRSEERKRRHRHSSSESSLGDRNSEERRRIISKWNKRYERIKENERKKRETAEAKINLALIEKKLAESAKNAENLIKAPMFNNNEEAKKEEEGKEKE